MVLNEQASVAHLLAAPHAAGRLQVRLASRSGCLGLRRALLQPSRLRDGLLLGWGREPPRVGPSQCSGGAAGADAEPADRKGASASVASQGSAPGATCGWGSAEGRPPAWDRLAQASAPCQGASSGVRGSPTETGMSSPSSDFFNEVSTELEILPYRAHSRVKTSKGRLPPERAPRQDPRKTSPT